MLVAGAGKQKQNVDCTRWEIDVDVFDRLTIGGKQIQQALATLIARAFFMGTAEPAQLADLAFGEQTG